MRIIKSNCTLRKGRAASRRSRQTSGRWAFNTEEEGDDDEEEEEEEEGRGRWRRTLPPPGVRRGCHWSWLVTSVRRTVPQIGILKSWPRQEGSLLCQFPPTHGDSAPPMTRIDTVCSPPGENLAALLIPTSRWWPLPNMRHARQSVYGCPRGGWLGEARQKIRRETLAERNKAPQDNMRVALTSLLFLTLIRRSIAGKRPVASAVRLFVIVCDTNDHRLVVKNSQSLWVYSSLWHKYTGKPTPCERTVGCPSGPVCTLTRTTSSRKVQCLCRL